MLPDLLIPSNYVTWEAQIYIRNDIPERLFAKMKAGGCVNLFIGLESGSDVVLQAMGKGFTAGEAAGFLHKLDKAGLQSEIALITISRRRRGGISTNNRLYSL